MEPFIGQIVILPFDFAPRGFMLCDGTLLPIAENTALYSLIGATFGGDGQTTFALPDYTGQAPK
jgi:microcystin-dependent protein